MDPLTTIKNYLLAQADKTTAWIGAIGLVLALLGFTNLMVFLCLALIVLPEGQFSEAFKKWTQAIKDTDKGGQS